MALERSLAGVEANVLDQVLLLLEGLATVVTLVRALARVCSAVPPHVSGEACRVATHQARQLTLFPGTAPMRWPGRVLRNRCQACVRQIGAF